MQNPSSSGRAEAERLLTLAARNLEIRDYKAARENALSAQDLEPLLEGTDQVVAITDVIFASEKRVGKHQDWYAILQIERRTDDVDLIKKQYRRLAFLLHPDKNRFSFADQAFKLVADAWSNLSDPSRKSAFDSAFGVFTKVNLVPARNARADAQASVRSERAKEPAPTPQSKAKETTPVTAEPLRATPPRATSFWTTCPYCYVLHQYPKIYEGCCLTCQSCNRTFEAVEMKTLPPLVPGKDAYYCCWGVFPIGFGKPDSENGVGNAGKGASDFPSWMPRMGSENVQTNHQSQRGDTQYAPEFDLGNVQSANRVSSMGTQAKRGRGRPKKTVAN